MAVRLDGTIALTLAAAAWCGACSPATAAGLADRFAPNSVRVSHYLNFDMVMPTPERAIPAEEAVAAVRRHCEEIRGGPTPTAPGMVEYWQDYRAVLASWQEPSTAKPVHYVTKDGTTLVARYLVGLQRPGRVGGFFAVDAADGTVIGELMWTPRLEPLWQVDAAAWAEAATANELDALAELMPPLDQFTSGIPIDPRDARWTIIDGFVGQLPPKTQEERREQVAYFNAKYGAELEVELKAKLVRRIATLKCMSVAASNAADWWSVRSGRPLPSYKNGVGGQKEYGHNPRVVESLYHRARTQVEFLERTFGDWKVAPFARDPVTGEAVPFSPRGIAEVLTNTQAGSVDDPLVPSLLQYPTAEHHFGMDQPPLLSQVFTEGLFPSTTIASLKRRAATGELPISLAPGFGEPMTPDRLARSLDTWGPHLGQHMQRTYGGKSRTGVTGMGVHCVLIVGYGMYEGVLHFVYRETFGGGGQRYLEDFFLGPEYRVMPAEYFYQAIGFPHHLYLDLRTLAPDAAGALVGQLEVTTNGRQDYVDPDRLDVLVDGALEPTATVERTARGTYRLTVPAAVATGAGRVELRASAKYFADAQGRSVFRVAAGRSGDRWELLDVEPLPPGQE